MHLRMFSVMRLHFICLDFENPVTRRALVCHRFRPSPDSDVMMATIADLLPIAR
jgi:hypothetical protein